MYTEVARMKKEMEEELAQTVSHVVRFIAYTTPLEAVLWVTTTIAVNYASVAQ